MAIFHLQRQYDIVRAPIDSGMGAVWRPGIIPGEADARVASLETLYDFWIDVVYDPDRALARDRAFRERLMRHPSVSACMNVREQAILAMDDKFNPPPTAKDKAAAQRLADYVNGVWARVKERDLLYQNKQQAILWGGVGHEWMWWKEADDTQRPHSAFAVDKSRFIVDRKGNMALRTRFTPVWGSYVKQLAKPTTGADQVISMLPKGKFTYHVYEKGFGTWEQPDLEGYQYYGRGEDEDLYDLVTRDLLTWVQEMLWQEQYGRPPRFLYVPENKADWNAWATSIATELLTKQVVRIPTRPSQTAGGNHRVFEVDQPDVPHAGFDAFGESRARNKKGIEEILLMNSGVLDHSDKGGYSDHVSRQKNGPDVLAKRDARRICATINDQLVPAIVRYGPKDLCNAPETDYPVLTMTPQRDDDPADVVEMFDKAAKLAPVSREEFYEKTGLRQPKTPDDTIFTGGVADAFEQAGGAPPDSEPTPDIDGHPMRQPIGGKDGGTETAE